jgi:AraC-like DNA-binding protein
MMLRNIESSVLASWVLAIYRTIQSYGIDPDPLLAEAGIDKTLLSQHQARIPSFKSNILWRLAVEKTKDPLIGAHVHEYITINSLYAVNAVVQASSTPREMLRSTCRFSQIVTTAVALTLEEQGNRAELFFKKVGDVELCDQAVDAYMFIIYWTLQPIMQLLDSSEQFFKSLEVTRPEIDETELYEETFDCPIKFGGQQNLIHVNVKMLDILLPGSIPAFTNSGEQMLVNHLNKIRNQDIEMQVRGAIMELMSTQNLSKDKVASRINTSARNLTRKLNEVDLTFNQLVDSIRQEKAISLIKQLEVSLTDISFQLGFIDVNSFIRSFRRWTGMTPGQYRKIFQITK